MEANYEKGESIDWDHKDKLIEQASDYGHQIAIINAQIAKKQRDDAKQLADDLAKDKAEADALAKKALNKFLDEVEAIAKADRFARESGERGTLKNIIDAQLKAYQDEIDNLITHEDNKAAIRKAAAQGAAALSKAINDKDKADKAEDDAEKEAAEKKLQDAITNLKAQAWQTANDLANNFFDAETMRLDARMNQLETAMANEITAAGNNADAKAKIEAKYAAQMKEIENEQRAVKRRQAIANKAIAAFEIGINTAIGISKAVAASPLTGGLPWSAIIAAMGALQLASVLTKPIPQFEKGVENFGGGLAVVGEKGSELIKTGDSISLSPNTATIMRLPKGTDVIPHDDTMKALAYASLGREVKVESENHDPEVKICYN